MSQRRNLKSFNLRTSGLEYDVAHFGDHFYLHTNLNQATNFQIMRTPVDHTTTEFWEPLLRHRKEVLVEDFELFDQYWVVNERENGLSRLRILRWDQSEDYYLYGGGNLLTLFLYNPI